MTLDPWFLFFIVQGGLLRIACRIATFELYRSLYAHTFVLGIWIVCACLCCTFCSIAPSFWYIHMYDLLCLPPLSAQQRLALCRLHVVDRSCLVLLYNKKSVCEYVGMWMCVYVGEWVCMYVWLREWVCTCDCVVCVRLSAIVWVCVSASAWCRA